MKMGGGIGAAGLIGSDLGSAQEQTERKVIKLEAIQSKSENQKGSPNSSSNGRGRGKSKGRGHGHGRGNSNPPGQSGDSEWVGVSPVEIEGTTNPTLTLIAGEKYAVEWTNSDGRPHNFTIEDSNDKKLVKSKVMPKEGTTQTVEFTASEEMDEYYSQPQQKEMRGNIEVLNEPALEVNILVFSATAGYRHENIEYGINQLKELKSRIVDETDADSVTIDAIPQDVSAFPTNASDLEQYDTVVWFNTTGDVLNADQQAAFEQYIQNGGGYAGIHAAADTEYDWGFYGDMLGGAWFDDHPSPQEAEIRVTDQVHPSTEHLPDRWTVTDEWYNYRKNPRGDVHILATLDESTYDLEDTNGMGADHPIAWAQEFQGGRAWFTGRGHTEDAFNEENFIEHVLGGLLWAGGLVEGNATGTVWDEHEREELVSGLTDPTAMAVADDGRLFFTHGRTNREIEEGDAKVSVYDPGTDSVSQALGFDIHVGGNTGLFGLELDPDFAENGWVYLQYAPLDEVVNRISRFTYSDSNIDLDSEVEILDVDVQRETSHHAGGDLQFGPEGHLYIATGDDTEFNASSNFTPIDEREGRKYWDAQRSSGNTNDLRGSILRIIPNDDGSYDVPNDNLFTGPEYADARENDLVREEIYVMGCRNPFKMHVDPETGTLWYSDYGPDSRSWDAERGPPGIVEVNRVTEAHFSGWPYFVGPNIPYVDYDFETEESGEPFDPENPINDSPNNTGLTELPPAREATIYYTYDWDVLLDNVPDYAETYVPDEIPYKGIGGGGAPHAGPVYRSKEGHGQDALSEYYDGKHFIMEYGQGWIKYATFDDGEFLEIEPFMPNTDFGINFEIEVAADGSLYHLDFGGTISRITGGRGSSTASASFTVNQSPLEPAGSTTGTVTLENVSDGDLTDLSFAVTAEGDAIEVTAPDQTTFDSLVPEENQSVEYDIVVGEDAAPGNYELEAEVTYTHDGEEMVVTASASATVSDPEAVDQYFWHASEYEAGDQPNSWEPKALVDEWGIDEDDDGLYLGVSGPASERTSLRYTEPDGAVEMEVWALAKGVDADAGDYWVYARGFDEDNPDTGLTVARADDYITNDQFRLATYEDGNLTIGETVDHVGANELYQVRLQVTGDTMRARWWPADTKEPDEWALDGSAPTEEPGYAGLGHWTGEPYQLYALGVGIDGTEAPSDDDDDGNGDGEPVVTFEFDGQTSGWVGIAPGEIEGKENPTLTLEEGEMYEIGWTEGDGIAHNIAIHNDEGDVVDDLSTDTTSDPGNDQWLEFEATAEMAEYICELHPSSMVGQVEIRN